MANNGEQDSGADSDDQTDEAEQARTAEQEAGAEEQGAHEQTHQREQTIPGRLKETWRSTEGNDKDAAAHKLKESIDMGYISNLDELRAAARTQVFALLGDEFEEASIKNEKIIKKFTNEIVWRVKSILNDGDTIFKEVTREHEQMKACYSITRRLFVDEGYMTFLGFLRNKKISGTGEDLGMPKNIDDIIEASQNDVFRESTMADDGRDRAEYSNFAAFSGNADYFLASITATERLYRAWNSAHIENQKDIGARIDTCKDKLHTINTNLKDNPDIRDTIPHIENNNDTRDWAQIKKAYEDTFDRAKELIKGNPSDSDLRLSTALLQGNEAEIDGWLDMVQEVMERKHSMQLAEEEAIRTREDEIEAANNTIDPIGVSAPKFEEAEEESHGLYDTMSNIMSANGRVTWYSWNDFEKAFETVAESVKAHVDQASGFKGGILAKYPTKWMGKDVHMRYNILDNQGDRKRTSEILPNMKNYSYEQLLADIGKRPKVGVDRRRAALEVLAERGNLRMDDPRLLKAIGAFGGDHPISKEKWEFAQKEGDYSAIRVIFKHVIDEDYIGEKNYGEELLNKQLDGTKHKKEFGSKINSSEMAGTPSAEISSIFHQIDEGDLEGDNILVGQLETSIKRSNIWSGNGDFQETEIDGVKMERNASSGFIVLKMIDGYLNGKIGAETINELSKSNEDRFTPFAAFQELIIKRKTLNNDGMYVSKIEEWGWVKDNKITENGMVNIIKFFDARTAEDAAGNARHIGVDSRTYGEHSGKRNSIDGFREKVGDKMIGACLKAGGGSEIYNASTLYNDAAKKMPSQNREVAFLIRAAVEEIQDAIEMKGNPRYTAVGKDGDTFRKNTNERLDRGYDGLNIMMENILKASPDRALTDATWEAYQTLEKDDDGLYIKPTKTSPKKNLRTFLTHELAQLQASDSNKYNDIMKSMGKLERDDLKLSHAQWKLRDGDDDRKMHAAHRGDEAMDT